jgi:DNA-binding transcriptional MerR regulator
MDRKGVAYTVGELAHLAGASVRTLRYYDEIGLLVAAARSDAGYRLYGRDELLRLQQILLYRELDVPLVTMQAILDDPGFDLVVALRRHREELEKRADRARRLIETIDRTLRSLEGETMPLSDAELYEGLTKEQRERYPREAREMFDPALVEESERRVRRLTPEQWKAAKAEGEAVNQALAKLMGRSPDDPEVQRWIARHHAVMNTFYEVTPERYRGLGLLYTEHPEFRAYYEKYAPGLADFLRKAIDAYTEGRSA